ncbi:MAG: Hsp20/alpha crystallin family protein [Deltaproteobacteria bacterium]|jgi:HSP20 family protein|nr:Hsp20/alpha crystallin family protein [Deltaproteobacteria bacterium]MBW2384345.1 Hsp20/alpha crystallin family protein [Deltaproteobacteria bacterium]MBW2696626.1 Hsp20/alpha crystallin family protein [Deltaproteobacteria bacterium]
MRDERRELPVRRSLFGEIDPFRDFFDSRRGLARLFREDWPEIGRSAGFAPAMDVHETEAGYAVTVELPGMKKEDVTVECREHLLTVKGEKRSEREEKDEHRHYTERSFGRFSRSVRLPSDAGDDVKARFDAGVLTIDIPKEEEHKPQVVHIES